MANRMSQRDADQAIREAYSAEDAAFRNINIASLVPEAYDYIALTYVTSGDGIGEIETVTYKTGGASGTTVATLTLTYDSSNNLETITRS
jgi:hypothetical protein